MSNNGQTARDVLAENLAAIRARVGMSSAQELADKVKELGGKLDRAAISKIESKARNVSLDEALVLAAALDVAPVHLFVSLDTNVLMQIAPKLDAVPAPDAREWVRGRRPLPSTSEKTYRTAWIPESEWEQRNARVEKAREKVEAARRRLRTAEVMVERLSDDYGKLDIPDQYELQQASLNRRFSSSLSGLVPDQSGPLKVEAMRKMLEAKLSTAYDQVAKATVDFEDARYELREAQAEAED